MSKNESTAFTPRDLELLAAAMRSTKGGEISIDYAKFATNGGFKNANSAKVSWYGLKKKLDKAAEVGADGATPPATPSGTGRSTPATGKKRRVAEKNDDEEGAEATPTKAKVKHGRKPKKQELEEEGTDAVPTIEGNEKEEAAIKTEDDPFT